MAPTFETVSARQISYLDYAEQGRPSRTGLTRYRNSRAHHPMTVSSIVSSVLLIVPDLMVSNADLAPTIPSGNIFMNWFDVPSLGGANLYGQEVTAGASHQPLWRNDQAALQKRLQTARNERNEILSSIDFKTQSDIIVSQDGEIRIGFVFCCYPKDHRLGDSEPNRAMIIVPRHMLTNSQG